MLLFTIPFGGLLLMMGHQSRSEASTEGLFQQTQAFAQACAVCSPFLASMSESDLTAVTRRINNLRGVSPSLLLRQRSSVRGHGNVLQQVGGPPVGAAIPPEDLSIGRDDCGAEGMRDQTAFFLVGQSKIIGKFR